MRLLAKVWGGNRRNGTGTGVSAAACGFSSEDLRHQGRAGLWLQAPGRARSSGLQRRDPANWRRPSRGPRGISPPRNLSLSVRSSGGGWLPSGLIQQKPGVIGTLKRFVQLTSWGGGQAGEVSGAGEGSGGANVRHYAQCCTVQWTACFRFCGD